MILCFQILSFPFYSFSLFFSVLIIIIYFWIWKKVSSHFAQIPNDNSKFEQNTLSKSLSIVVPFRNEALRITPLLDSFTKIKTSLKIEILFVDDHSTDQTVNIIQNHSIMNQFHCEIIPVPENESGKKSAVHCGVQNARYDTIFTTDADCQLQVSSIDTIFSEYTVRNANFCIGPVYFLTSKLNPFQIYQKIENTILVALGLYQFNSGKPTMANGANLMFNKELFLSLNPFKTNQTIAGGDDIFALEAFFENNPQKVIAISNSKSAVFTNVVENFNEFWHQRVRWIRKTQAQKTKNTAKSQILLAIFFLFFWGITLISLFHQHYEITAIIWLGKLISDFYSIHKIFKNFDLLTNFKEIFYASIFQNFFLPALGIFSIFQKSVHWKNRTY